MAENWLVNHTEFLRRMWWVSRRKSTVCGFQWGYVIVFNLLLDSNMSQTFFVAGDLESYSKSFSQQNVTQGSHRPSIGIRGFWFRGKKQELRLRELFFKIGINWKCYILYSILCLYVVSKETRNVLLINRWCSAVWVFTISTIITLVLCLKPCWCRRPRTFCPTI